MKKRNWGRVVFIFKRERGTDPAEMIHYGMTKTAQLAIARGLAETTAGTAVTVSSVWSGPTAWVGVSQFVQQLAAEQGADAETIEREFFRGIRPT